jgi:excisionase family DNA binding protein
MNVKTPPQTLRQPVHPPVQCGRLYTVQEAAETLRLPATWLYECTRKDAIPHHKMGKYVRFTEADIAAIIEMCSKVAWESSSAGIQEEVA